MSYKQWLRINLVLIAAVLLTACGGPATTQAPAEQPTAAPPTEAPAVEQPTAEPPTEAPAEAPTEAPAAVGPTELKIGVVLATAIESPYNTAFLQSLERVTAAAPHGLTITYDLTEEVGQPDAERVLREYAESGEYGIIWANSTFSDQVAILQGEYPDIAWVYAGAGNVPLGGNAYWVDVYIHEPAYLMGIIAGKMTKTNIIGAVAAFPFANVNIPVNAFLAGAQSVNPDAQMKTTFIESWFDPPKAKEAALAQIAAGADLIYAERFGVFDAAAEKGILAFGSQVDQNSVAPDVVVSSAVIHFDPHLNFIIDEWYNHVANDSEYHAPYGVILYGMRDGGSELAPYHGLEDVLSQDVLDAVEQAQADIQSGALVVALNDAPPGE